MRQAHKKKQHANSVIIHFHDWPLFGTYTVARRCTDPLRPPPPCRWHGTAQAVYASPPPTHRAHSRAQSGWAPNHTTSLHICVCFRVIPRVVIKKQPWFKKKASLSTKSDCTKGRVVTTFCPKAPDEPCFAATKVMLGGEGACVFLRATR